MGSKNITPLARGCSVITHLTPTQHLDNQHVDFDFLSDSFIHSIHSELANESLFRIISHFILAALSQPNHLPPFKPKPILNLIEDLDNKNESYETRIDASALHRNTHKHTALLLHSRRGMESHESKSSITCEQETASRKSRL